MDRNWYARILGIRYQHEINDRLSLYQPVGTVEPFEDSVACLGALLGVPLAQDFSPVNTSRRESDVLTALMNWPAFQHQFAQVTLDFELHNQAAAMLDRSSAATRQTAGCEL